MSNSIAWVCQRKMIAGGVYSMSSIPLRDFDVKYATRHNYEEMVMDCDGMFVMDGFMKMESATATMPEGEYKWKGPAWHVYVFQIIEQIHNATGMQCAFIILENAKFNNGGYSETLSMIERYLEPPDWMVWISMGGDLYPKNEMAANLMYELGHRLNDLLIEASGYCAEQRLVYGGSARMWEYAERLSKRSADIYDQQVAYITDSSIVPSMTGERFFWPLNLICVANNGHVWPEHVDVLKRGFVSMAEWAAQGARRRTLL